MHKPIHRGANGSSAHTEGVALPASLFLFRPVLIGLERSAANIKTAPVVPEQTTRGREKQKNRHEKTLRVNSHARLTTRI